MNTETMGLDYVRTFVKVGQSSTMLEACKKLHIAQSNVSRHIKALEEELQTKLLENVRGKIVLTEDGQTIFKLYEEAYNKIMYAEKVIQQRHSANSGKISIGCMDGLDTTYMDKLILKFYKKYSNLIFKVSSGNQAQLVKELSSYRVDFIISLKGNYKKSDNFIEKKVTTLKYCFVSKDKDIDLTKAPLILPTNESYNREKVNEYFENEKIKPNIFLELNETNSILNYVKKGVGVGFVPSIVAESDKSLHILTIPEEYDDDIYITYDNKLLASTVKEFIDMIVAQ